MAEFIVVTTLDTDQAAFVEHLTAAGITIEENYEHLQRHYRVAAAEDQHALLTEDPRVLMLERADAPVKIGEVQTIHVGANGYGDNWGLARLQTQEWKKDSWYPFWGEYRYTRRGSGVDLYVVDTGVRMSHQEFGGRAVPLFDAFRSVSDPQACLDTEGHGTHVAATAAGTRWGVAKGATVRVVKVFQGPEASIASIVGGINAVLRHHREKLAKGDNTPSIANLSLGGPAVSVLEQAVNDCIDAGIVMVVAAGNEGKNLDGPYDVMPAEVRRAVTVGATDIQDVVADFSNYGSILDLFAPGHYIVAAAHDSDTGMAMKSGTSMASPHVAGVAALYAEGRDIGKDAAWVADIHDTLVRTATPGTLRMPPAVKQAGSPNLMLYSPFSVAVTVKEVEAVLPNRDWRSSKRFNSPVIARRLQALEGYYREFGSPTPEIDALLAEAEIAAEALVHAKPGPNRVKAHDAFQDKLAACRKLIEAQA